MNATRNTITKGEAMATLCNQWDRSDTVTVEHPEQLADLGIVAVYTKTCGLCSQCAALCEFDGYGDEWTFERPGNAMCECENCGAKAA